MNRRSTANVVSITTARRSLPEDVRDRQRKYVVTMGVRTCCFILAIAIPVAWQWKILLIVAATFLPWVAVILANAGRSAPDRPSTLLGTVESSMPALPYRQGLDTHADPDRWARRDRATEAHDRSWHPTDGVGSQPRGQRERAGPEPSRRKPHG